MIGFLGAEEFDEFRWDAWWVYMFEGAESDAGSRKGLYGAREEPGSDVFEWGAECYECL